MGSSSAGYMMPVLSVSRAWEYENKHTNKKTNKQTNRQTIWGPTRVARFDHRLTISCLCGGLIKCNG